VFPEKKGESWYILKDCNGENGTFYVLHQESSNLSAMIVPVLFRGHRAIRRLNPGDLTIERTLVGMLACTGLKSERAIVHDKRRKLKENERVEADTECRDDRHFQL